MPVLKMSCDKENNMSKKTKQDKVEELLPEYDFSGDVRGKYADDYAKGNNVVLLDPNVSAVFQDSKSVNDALRAIIKIAQKTKSKNVS